MKKILSIYFLFVFIIVGANSEAMAEDPSRGLTFFVDNFEVKGGDQQFGMRMTSIIARKLTESHPNAKVYTQKTISLLKREVQKQLKEAKNCNAEKCQRQVSRALDADYTISGDASLSSDGKLNFHIMALSKSMDEELVTNEFDVTCYEEQLEYFADEIKKNQ